MARSRWLAAALTAIVVIGPMTQMTAVAQTPPPPLAPAAPPTVIVPAPPPAPAAPPTVIVPAPAPAAPPTVVVPGPAVVVPAPPSATTSKPTPPSGVVVVPPAAPPMQSMQPEAVPDMDAAEPGIGAKIGAGVLNVVYVPGKAIVCSAGTLVAGGFMLLTFGFAYREAVSFFNEGCRGPWVLTPEQVAAVPKHVQFEY